MIEYPIQEPPLVWSPEIVRTHEHRCGKAAPQFSKGGVLYHCRRREGHTGRHAHIYALILTGLVRAVWK